MLDIDEKCCYNLCSNKSIFKAVTKLYCISLCEIHHEILVNSYGEYAITNQDKKIQNLSQYIDKWWKEVNTWVHD